MKFKKDDDLELSSGLGKLIHALTWPIRKFYITIPLLTLILATPIFFGVKVTEIPVWYKEKSIEAWNEAPYYFASGYNKIKGMLGFEVDDVKVASKKKSKRKLQNATQERGIDILVDAPKRRTSATSRRKGFNVAENDIPRIAIEVEGGEIIETTEIEDIVVYSDVSQPTPAQPNQAKIEDEPISFVIRPSAQRLPLIYLQTPKTISGKAIIRNANELEVDNVYILLYGIYAKPDTIEGAQARAYLDIRARKGDIKCSIVAYTYQNVATAVCFSGRENLNKSLVEKGYSQNVALED